MRYCDYNITVGFVVINLNNLFLIKENGKRLDGYIGKIMDRYFSLKKKHSCKFIDGYEFGQKIANGTYTGMLKMLKEKKLDVVGYPKPIFLNEHFLHLSKGYFEDGFYTGQVINPKLNDNITFSLEMFIIEFLLILFPVLIFLITFLFLFKILPKFNLIKKSEFIIRNLFEIEFNLTKKCNPISLIVIFYIIYFMIYKEILTNNIKSNQIVVDTSDLISTKEDLLNSKRPICYWRTEFEFRFISSSLKGSYLNKVFLKSEENVCSFTANAKTFLTIEFEKVTIFVNKFNMYGILSFIANSIPKISTFFISKEPLFKAISTVIMRKDLDKINPQLMKIPLIEHENGLLQLIYNKIYWSFMSTFIFDNKRIFYSKTDYVSKYSGKFDLGFNYLQDTLQLYFTLNLIVLSIFILHHLKNYFYRPIRRLLRKALKSIKIIFNQLLTYR